MQKTFSVSVPAETRTLHPKGDGKAEVTYTVTNSKSNPARARVQVVPKDGASEWFEIGSDSERDFGAEESQQFKVVVAIPPETPAGTYAFRIDAVNVANPQEDFAEGESVSCQWKPPAPETKTRLPKWLVPAVIGAVVLIALVVGAWVWFSGDDPAAVLDDAGFHASAGKWEKFFGCWSTKGQKDLMTQLAAEIELRARGGDEAKTAAEKVFNKFSISSEQRASLAALGQQPDPDNLAKEAKQIDDAVPDADEAAFFAALASELENLCGKNEVRDQFQYVLQAAPEPRDDVAVGKCKKLSDSEQTEHRIVFQKVDGAWLIDEIHPGMQLPRPKTPDTD